MILSRVPWSVLNEDHAVAVSHHDATPLTSEKLVHHLRGRNPMGSGALEAEGVTHEEFMQALVTVEREGGVAWMDSTKLELYARDLSGLQWRKSSRSANDDPPDNCVEIATFPDGVVAQRDSKNRTGPVLMFPPDEWAAFTGGVQAGEFD
jgi:hypothetical protein